MNDRTLLCPGGVGFTPPRFSRVHAYKTRPLPLAEVGSYISETKTLHTEDVAIKFA